MLSRPSLLLLLFVLAVGLSGCELVGDVLEFGFWMILIIAAIVIGLIVWIVKKIF
jgi:hypothetical protein